MQFKRTAVRTIIASRILASAAGQAKTALISATAGTARSPAAARAIAPLSVLSGSKSFPKAARTSSAVGTGRQISLIALLGGFYIVEALDGCVVVDGGHAAYRHGEVVGLEGGSEGS
jgi:hypothetical protein